MAIEAETKTRRRYVAPELRVHGNVVEVTLAVGVKGSKDGGMGKAQKTGF